MGIRFFALATAFAPILGLGAEPTLKPLSEIPLNQCSTHNVIDSLYRVGLERDDDYTHRSVLVMDQLSALVKSLPQQKNVPVLSQMTPDQVMVFGGLRSQLLVHELGVLAESIRMRDLLVIRGAANVIERLYKVDKASQGDPDRHDADGLILVMQLRKALATDDDKVRPPTSSNACDLDLALWKQEERIELALGNLVTSTEAKELSALALKYKMESPLDPEKLPSPDREKAIWLREAVGVPAKRTLQAVHDWEYLRRFADVSGVEYSSFREDIVAGAGSKEYDYDTAVKRVYAAADLATKHTIDAWNFIDVHMPTAEEKAKK